MDVENKFFLQTKTGAEGIKETQEHLRKQTEAFEAYKRSINKNKKDGTLPVGEPRPEAVAPAK